MSHVRDIRHVAGRTPADRDRSVDLLRALAICVVAAGHWMAVVVTTGGGIDGSTALSYLGWAHPLTWVFQVMPIFFLVGGFANGASLSSHQRRGGDAFGWLLNRGARLLRPTTAFLVLLAATGFVAHALGGDPRLVALGIWAASIPLWFLAAYLGLVFLAPVLHAAHLRYGLAFPAAVAVAVLGLDVARLQFDVPLVAGANYLLVWLVFHQVGIAWQDGTIALRPAACAGLAATGVAVLVALTTLGPYPVSMVNVPENELHNTSPPTVALLVLGLTQAAAALSLSSGLNRWLQQSRLWTGVVAVNAFILTVFLWHMAAAAVTASIVYPAGILPEPPVDTGRWLLWRLPWLAACAMVLAVLVAAFSRIELGAARSSRVLTVPSPAPWRAGIIAGMAAVVGGLVMIAMADRTYEGVGGLPAWALVLYLAGAGVLRLAHRHHTKPIRDESAKP